MTETTTQAAPRRKRGLVHVFITWALAMGPLILLAVALLGQSSTAIYAFYVLAPMWLVGVGAGALSAIILTFRRVPVSSKVLGWIGAAVGLLTLGLFARG